MLDQIKPELSIEVQMTKLKHMMTRRQDFMETTIMLRIFEGSRKKRTMNMRWIDSINEIAAFRLEDLCRAVKNH